MTFRLQNEHAFDSGLGRAAQGNKPGPEKEAAKAEPQGQREAGVRGPHDGRLTPGARYR